MSFPSWMKVCAGGVALFLVAILAACTVVVEDSPGRPGPGPVTCTAQYDPVCARRGNDRQTFSNACVAESSGYRVVRRGECGRGDSGGQNYCPQRYDPVCARRGGDRRTFSNSCLADQAGYRVIAEGECRRMDDTPRFCTREYAPVCARRGSQVRTFPNSCEADVAGFRIISSGPC